ncbi:cytochrome P450 [Conexibacter sp. JD483]|uniref:cytochrome P450 n=1 Tax=unclassified Conexibacter TaxID=2627773 RepID=UPI002719C437|nr:MULTISPECIES: cytochrome P450 [unclassified Conexibacter]MDO8188987.1 cytochrome P450 [Conexibacter sp. CPCC 205706]MDO8201801.1 cytochrome P450 [Conexibacter sp. CPCC 205762]MDR9371510.1 cytochrome P450 [Conexibacter sp. JD483]
MATPVTELQDLPAFDYTDAELHGPRFHATMAQLRSDGGWLASTPLGYVVLEREAASFFLRTRACEFPGMKIAELFQIEEGALLEEMRRNILHLNGDQHRRLRALVNPAFTPRAVERWRPRMRAFLQQLWDGLPAGGREPFDLVEAFAKPYPSLTIATVMGAPLADAPRLHEWSNWIQRQFDPPVLMSERPRIERAVEQFYAYAGELLELRRRTPGDDLISQLIAAEQEGDRLSDVELVNLVLNVLIGGVDTTQSQLAHALRLLAQEPEQWAALRADPQRLAPAAVEEALRYEPITPFTARIVVEPVEYDGVLFPRDTVVLVCAFSANRDGVGDGFEITRASGGPRPLTFGAGVHYCLGANLARAELQEALTFLARKVERLELAGAPVFEGVQGVYGLASLPLRFTPATDG